MDCKICKSKTNKIFEKEILLKYPVSYYQCENCGFIQTEKPYWLKEAYSDAITSLDIGILDRNKFLLKEIPKIINTFFPNSQIYLDFAGGYGLFARSMRDLGFDFYRQDIYCENLFAKHFDINDIAINSFDVVTAFELVEHLENPIQEIESILKYSDNFIFSTELIPENQNVENWIYIAEETGQHIAFYTKKSLEIISEKFGKSYYNKGHLHIFTSDKISQEQIDYAIKDIDIITVKRKFLGTKKVKNIKFIKERESYQERDYLKIKEILKKNAKK